MAHHPWPPQHPTQTIWTTVTTAPCHHKPPANYTASPTTDCFWPTTAVHVYALDGVSGRLQWSVSLKKLAAFELSPLAPDPRQNNRGFNANRYGLGTSPRSVTAHNHQAFAVLGPVHTANTPPLSNLLVCLDTQTGIAQWIARPSDVDATVAKALFHGTPQLTDDLVIIAARHSHPASFQDSYLVAFDRHSGVVRWRRHLSSTTAANSQQYADTKSLTTFTVPPAFRPGLCLRQLGCRRSLRSPHRKRPLAHRVAQWNPRGPHHHHPTRPRPRPSAMPRGPAFAHSFHQHLWFASRHHLRQTPCVLPLST